MKALSIMQPWAWAIVQGYKDIENRSWATSYRGPVLVHAGRSVDKDAWAFLREMLPGVYIPLPSEILKGGIVGVTEITGCVTRHPSRWFFGSYGFVLTNSKPLDFRPCRGQLGFFDPDTDRGRPVGAAKPDQGSFL
jgi:hypothetical protein